jgi:hypothetical protein
MPANWDPGTGGVLLHLPEGWVTVFEPVTHSAQYFKVDCEKAPPSEDCACLQQRARADRDNRAAPALNTLSNHRQAHPASGLTGIRRSMRS